MKWPFREMGFWVSVQWRTATGEYNVHTIRGGKLLSSFKTVGSVHRMLWLSVLGSLCRTLCVSESQPGCVSSKIRAFGEKKQRLEMNRKFTVRLSIEHIRQHRTARWQHSGR